MATTPRTSLTPRTTPRSHASPPAAPVPAAPLQTTGSVPSEVSLQFRTKRVSEIRAIDARIRADIDDKADSLRNLLGTRYSDLLLAADRLFAMHAAAETHVRASLAGVAAAATTLRDRFAPDQQRSTQRLLSAQTRVVARANGSRELADALAAIERVLPRGDDRWDAACKAALHGDGDGDSDTDAASGDDDAATKEQGKDIDSGCSSGSEAVFALYAPLLAEHAAVVARDCVASAVDRVDAAVAAVWKELGVGPANTARGMTADGDKYDEAELEGGAANGSGDGAGGSSAHAGRRVWARLFARAVALPTGSDSAADAARNSSAADDAADVARLLACDGRVGEVVTALDAALRAGMTDVAVVTGRMPAVRAAFAAVVTQHLPRALAMLVSRAAKLEPARVPAHGHLALFAARCATALQTALCVVDPFRAGAAAAGAAPA